MGKETNGNYWSGDDEAVTWRRDCGDDKNSDEDGQLWCAKAKNMYIVKLWLLLLLKIPRLSCRIKDANLTCCSFTETSHFLKSSNDCSWWRRALLAISWYIPDLLLNPYIISINMPANSPIHLRWRCIYPPRSSILPDLIHRRMLHKRRGQVKRTFRVQHFQLYLRWLVMISSNLRDNAMQASKAACNGSHGTATSCWISEVVKSQQQSLPAVCTGFRWAGIAMMNMLSFNTSAQSACCSLQERVID